MKTHDTLVFASRQAELDERLDPRWQPETVVPVLAGGNIHYQISSRTRAVDCGGLGLMQQLVDTIGLREAIDRQVEVFKRHLPYHESDHVINLTYNILTGGTCLEDLERRRQDVNYLEAVGARRIPDPTTAGDFLRRFRVAASVESLLDAINDVRRRIWRQQPRQARQLALIDLDGTIQETSGECKQGIDFAYNGKCGYGPLVVSLANTQEVLYTVNRPANRPSHDGAAKWIEKGIEWAHAAGFRRVRLRGDTDFSLTVHFDRWAEAGVEFVFGVDANPSFVALAAALPAAAWRPLERRASKPVQRARRPNVKAAIIRARQFENLRLDSEYVSEVTYRPTSCRGTYRLVILLKNITVERGEHALFDEIRFLFYVTDIPQSKMSAEQVIRENNARCNQENLIEQLKNGVQAMRMPVGDLVANWAYMVIASLAWNLKAWLALVLPRRFDTLTIQRMEFKRFVKELMLLPCQVLRSGRQLIYRLLTATRWAGVILEASLWLRAARYG